MRSGRTARVIGIVFMVVGLGIVACSATGMLNVFNSAYSTYMVGGVTAAYGLLRYLRGRTDDQRADR